MLHDFLRRSLPLPDPPLGGWLTLNLTSPDWGLVLQAFYAVHALLRWKVTAEPLPHLREGVWLAQAHDTREAVARAEDRRSRCKIKAQLARKRRKVIKHQLKGLLRTCEQCGTVYFLGAHPCCLTEARHGAHMDGPSGSSH
jgi:hypothetical protein